MGDFTSDFDLRWCQDLIHSKDLFELNLPDRRPPPPLDTTLTNTLFAETLRTERTIRAWVVLSSREQRPERFSPDFIILLSLGNGLDGYRGIAHGGFSVLVMDQAINMCATMMFGNSVSVESWQRFKRSIRLPNVVVCQAVCTRVDGERARLESRIEDGAGKLYCEGGSVRMLCRKDAKAKI